MIYTKKDISQRGPVRLGLQPVGSLGGENGGAIDPLATPEMKENEEPAIGNTYLHVKNYLEKSGIIVISETSQDTPSDVDAIVDYYDFWEWDFKDFLKILKVTFKDPKTGKIFAEGLYEADKAGLHDYPTSESEVPNVLGALLKELPNS